MNVHVAQTEPVIELRRVHRFFNQTKAVNDVSFDVYRGQVFGFIGPNGAGKTTTMRILATLDSPSYGDALVDGFSVINDPDLVRRRLGFMPDGSSLYANMNCVEYLDFFGQFLELFSSLDDVALADGWATLHAFYYIPEVLLHLEDVVSALVDLLSL